MKVHSIATILTTIVVIGIIGYNAVIVVRGGLYIPPTEKIATTTTELTVEEEKPEIVVVEPIIKQKPPEKVIEPPTQPQKVEFNNNVYINGEKVTNTPPSDPKPTPAPEPERIYIPVYIPEPTTASTPLTETTPQSMKSLEIISPINGKGLNREYTAQDPIVDESNYIELGLVVRGDDGKDVNTLEVVITATDASQNKTLTSTGNVKKIYDSNGVGTITHYYPYHYEFKTAEDHTITFSVPSLQLEETVTVTVTEPEPA